MADPFLAALGLKDPTEAAAHHATVTTPKAYDPLDAAVRTVMAEESNPTGQQWVAGVIANRAKKGGKNLLQVVQEPGQFEPWMTDEGRAKIAAIDPNSDEYKAVAAKIAPILKGEAPDPTGGATQFYAPKLQADLGRAKPEWDDGKGKAVGGSLFFGGSADAPDPFLSTIGADEAKANQAAAERAKFTAEGLTTYRDMKEHLTPQQEHFFAMMSKGGGYKPTLPGGEMAPGGTQSNPYFLQAGMSPQDVPAGHFYVPREEGTIKQAATGQEPAHAGVGESVLQGAADVGGTILNMFPGAEDSTLRNRVMTDRAIYDAQYKGDLESGVGRFTGQVLGAAPVAAGVEAAAGLGLTKAALPKAAAFLAGEGGAGVPGVAGFLTRGGSLATKGAFQGGVGGAVLDPNDTPLAERVGFGAAGGALLGPTLPFAGGAGRRAGEFVRDAVDPLTEVGRGRIANRIIGNFAEGAPGVPNAAELVPGSVPTLATATANPGIASLERTTRLVRPAPFAERDLNNAQARADFFERLSGDEDTVKALEAKREDVTSKLRAKAFAGAGVADPSPVVSTIDTILKGPSGQRDVVTKALSTIRGKLVGEQGPQTDVEQLYGVRKAIGDMLDPLGPNETKGATLAKSELMQVKTALDKAIETAAPGFKQYLSNYAELSRPVDEQKLLQSLKLTDMRGNITLNRVQSAIAKVKDMRAKGGANKAKSVSDDTLVQLRALRDDLRRGDNINLGRPLGSDTAQHLVNNATSAKLNVPLGVGAAILHHPLVGAAVGAGKLFYGMKNQQVLDQLAARLLDPEALAAPVLPASVQAVGPMRRVGQAVLPVLGGQVVNQLTGP